MLKYQINNNIRSLEVFPLQQNNYSFQRSYGVVSMGGAGNKKFCNQINTIHRFRHIYIVADVLSIKHPGKLIARGSHSNTSFCNLLAVVINFYPCQFFPRANLNHHAILLIKLFTKILNPLNTAKDTLYYTTQHLPSNPNHFLDNTVKLNHVSSWTHVDWTECPDN